MESAFSVDDGVSGGSRKVALPAVDDGRAAEDGRTMRKIKITANEKMFTTANTNTIVEL